MQLIPWLYVNWLYFLRQSLLKLNRQQRTYVYWTVHHCDSWRIKDQLDVTCYFYFTSYALNMFRTLIYPSSGACDYSVQLPHWSVFLVRCVLVFRCGWVGVVIQQNSRKLLMVDILMSETCWAHKKWNKIASDIKLVSYSSTITMMHGSINVRSWIAFGQYAKLEGTCH